MPVVIRASITKPIDLSEVEPPIRVFAEFINKNLCGSPYFINRLYSFLRDPLENGDIGMADIHEATYTMEGRIHQKGATSLKLTPRGDIFQQATDTPLKDSLSLRMRQIEVLSMRNQIYIEQFKQAYEPYKSRFH